MAKALKRGIIEASHRLRMVQKDFADQDERKQREYLCEELERLLSEIPFAERGVFLQGLLERFPTPQPQTSEDTGPVVPPDNAPRLVSDQPMQLVDALIEMLPALSDDERKAVADRLQEALAGSMHTTETPTKSAKNIRSTLHLPDDVEMHRERFGDLANLLAESKRRGQVAHSCPLSCIVAPARFAA